MSKYKPSEEFTVVMDFKKDQLYSVVVDDNKPIYVKVTGRRMYVSAAESNDYRPSSVGVAEKKESGDPNRVKREGK